MDRFLGFVKLFVVVAGLALVLGTVGLVYMVVQRGQEQGRPADPLAVSAGVARPADAASPEVRAELAIPPGAVVIDMQLNGPQALLLLRTVDGDEYLALIDPATGRRRSLVHLVEEGH